MPQSLSTITSTIPPTYPTSMPPNPACRAANTNSACGRGSRMPQSVRQRTHASSSRGASTRQSLHATYTSNSIPSYNYYPINTARPSMTGWWRCCSCGGDNNPAYEMGRCVLCGHYSCPSCRALG